MARAETYTALSLDRFARFFGINPVHFNSGNQVNLDDGRIIWNVANSKNNIWPQYSWQNSDQISREELAMTIAGAEYEVSEFLGSYLIPTWVEGEDIPIGNGYYKFSNDFSSNPLTNEISLNLPVSRFISGGVRKLTLVDTPEIEYRDDDGDTWYETARISFDVTSYNDYALRYFRYYFEGEDGEKEWEVRYPRKVWKIGSTIYADFDCWLLIEPELFDLPSSNDSSGKSVDITTTDNLVTHIDVYLEENDTTQKQVEFYKTKVTDGGTPQKLSDGYIKQYKAKSNEIVPTPASYNSTTGVWDNACCLELPDSVKLWYYSGASRTTSEKKYSVNDYLARDLARAISYISVARLERPWLSNNNSNSLAERMREELINANDGRRFVTEEIQSCPFGYRAGEFQAWQLLKRFVGITLKAAVL